jgi:hypothetical protein
VNTEKHKIPTCPRCGSAHISADAAARFDAASGDWQVTDIFDMGKSCDDCGAEFSEPKWIDSQAGTDLSQQSELNPTEREHFVHWMMPIDAVSNVDAAKKALSIHRNPESIATVFIVNGPECSQEIDALTDEVLPFRDSTWRYIKTPEMIDGSADTNLYSANRIEAVFALDSRGDTERDTWLSDHLADVRHWCRVHEIDIGDRQKRADQYFIDAIKTELLDKQLEQMCVKAQAEADKYQTTLVVGWGIDDHTGMPELTYCPDHAIGPAFVSEVVRTIEPNSTQHRKDATT